MKRHYNEETLNRLRAYLPRYVESITQKSKGGNWVCPVCGSGTGPHKTGALHIYPDTMTWACYAHVKHEAHGKTEGDIFAMIGQYEHIADFPAQVRRAAEIAGIDVQPVEEEEPPRRKEKAAQPAAGSVGGEKPDYTSYYKVCRDRIGDASGYLNSRGISVETARRLWVGYDPQADPANNPGGIGGETLYPEGRIIVPMTKSSYTGRAVRPGAVLDKANSKGGKAYLFNGPALYRKDNRAIFVTEGAFDALSVEEAGFPAVALNSADNAEIFLDVVKDRKPVGVLILCLDSDDAGRGAREKIERGLRDEGVEYVSADINCGCKDANEAMQRHPEEFRRAVRRVWADAIKPGNLLSYLEGGYDTERKAYREGGKATGFAAWDEATGGLKDGHSYILAAPPGVGKTTLAWQIADNLACAGEDVLYITLEQRRFDLASKSIVRRVAQKNLKSAATEQDVKEGRIKAAKEMREVIEQIGDRLTVEEAKGAMTARDVGKIVEAYMSRTGKKPVVFLDYLQRLAPLDAGRRIGNREAVGDNSKELCDIKRRLGVTMMIISSVNRASYRGPLDIDSLKEAGELEYDADACYVLEYGCMYGQDGKLNELFLSDGNDSKKKSVITGEKEKKVRELMLRCVKTRQGDAQPKQPLTFYAGKAYFAESDAFQKLDSDETTPFDLRT